MKNVIICLLFICKTPSFASDKIKKIKKAIVTTLAMENKKIVNTYTYEYNANGFVSKISVFTITTYGKKGEGHFIKYNKGEQVFVYNNKNELIEEFSYSFTGKEKKLNFKINYSYNSIGKITKSQFVSEEFKKTRVYHYNDVGLISSVERNMPNIELKMIVRYSHTDKKLFKEVNNHPENKLLKQSKYKFDDKINPMSLNFPMSYCNVFPESLFSNNIIELQEVGKKYTTKSVTDIKYNEEGLAVTSSCKKYQKGKLLKTILKKFFY